MKHSELRHQPRHVNPRIQGASNICILPELKSVTSLKFCIKIFMFIILSGGKPPIKYTSC